MVLVGEKEAVDQEMQRRHPILRTVRATTGPVNNWSAVDRGKEKGSQINIRNPLNTDGNGTIA
jgi:hypothetical protein